MISIYRLVQFHDIPQVVFAHKHTTNHYDSYFEPVPNRIEFTLYKYGNVIKTYNDGSTLFIPQNSIAMTVNDHSFRMHSPDASCCHHTFAIKMEHSTREISEEDMLWFNHPLNRPDEKHSLHILLSDYIPLHQHNAYLEPLIMRIIETHAIQTRVAQTRCLSIVLELIAALTDEVVRAALLSSSNFSPANTLYVHKAMEYISNHLSQKMTVNELADYVQISPSYLSGLFKAYTGQSIVDYINRLKIEQIKELMVSNKDILLKEAGENVGITDENYLSRLFKRYAGMSAREFQRMIGNPGDAV